MLFNSVSFLIFFPIVVLICFILPQRVRWIWLLISSYYFYMSWNAAYALLLFLSTFTTWILALACEGAGDREKAKKGLIAAALVINLGILAYYKYFTFILTNISAVLGRFNVSFNVPQFDVILPVGISFYTFQALGYAIDVYRGETKAERNFFRYALFVSFFPQLVAGPIERSKNLLRQMQEGSRLTYENLRLGFMMMLCGYFLKVVMADNIAIVVNSVYGDTAAHPGAYLILATVLFAFQIYGDFGGYSLIARGAARIMGFSLMENFNAPYLSRSVAEFWHRWHISLSQWFRDYLYIPLGGNRKGTVRKYFNVMVVFLLSGLWHGASWNFVIWGGLNGLFQVIEGIFKSASEKAAVFLRIRTDTASHGIFKVILTFILVDFTWLFFRAGSGGQAVDIIRSMVTDYNPWVLFTDDLYTLGLGAKQFAVMVYSILAVLVLDIFKVRGVNLYSWVFRQQFWFRLCVYMLILWTILTFGAWGGGYNENTFLYFQF